MPVQWSSPESVPCNVLMTVFGQWLLWFLPLEHELCLREMLCDQPLLLRSPMLDVVSPESPTLGSTTLQSWGGKCLQLVMKCVFVCERMRYVRVCECFSGNACFQTTTLAGFSLPGTRGESHLPQHRQPVINPSTVCQREQQKASSSSDLTVNSLHSSLLSQHQFTLTSCY